mgnify:CR=1 FL=1
MVFQNNVLSGAGGSGTAVHTIDQSIRFNGVDTPQLTRTPSSSGNLDKWTFSCWVKRGKFGQSGGGGSHQVFLSAGNDVNNFTFFGFRDSGSLPSGGVAESLNLVATVGGVVIFELSTTQVFRDPSAWSHIVGVYDSGNSVSSERCRVYVNGSRITEFNVETYPSQNQDSDVNESGVVQRVGAFNLGGNKGHLDGYMAEIVLIDGQALDPSSFGEYNSSNIWVPKDVSGLTFGTNGFHIKGQDSSDLGNDSSGNNNDYTTSGLAAHDQVLDSPTNNYCVISPLDSFLGSTTWANGNLQIGGASNITSSSISVTSGKWYVEVRKNANADNQIGVMSGNTNQSSAQLGTSQFRRAWRDNNNSPQFLTDDSTSGSGTAESLAAGDILGIALDLDNDAIYFADNNTWMNSGDPTSGASKTGAIFTDLNLHDEWRWFTGSNSLAVNNTWNFGQDGTFGGTETAQGNADGNGHGNFYYAPPSGYLAVNTKNLGS